MRRGERAKMGATAEVFGTGAAAGSSSDSSLQNTDGDLEACRRTDSNAEAPEAGCGTPLRLYMLPISAQGSALKPPPQEQEVVHVPKCPEGMARQGGKCVKATSGPVCATQTPGACEATCKSGDALGCGIYGLALLRGDKGMPKSAEAASVSFARGCELGNEASCFYLSLLYREGKGVTQDMSRAALLADRGCALGHGRACFLSGLSYMKGEGVEPNESRAFSAYEQGCAAGDASSCTNLGKSYSTGRGVAPDVVKSFKLYLRACEAGSGQGCYNVGSRYSKGKGTEQSAEKRLQYYLRACKLDHAKGCLKAGQTLQNASLIQRSCELGYDKACQQ
jgi:TPR repeat protein